MVHDHLNNYLIISDLDLSNIIQCINYQYLTSTSLVVACQHHILYDILVVSRQTPLFPITDTHVLIVRIQSPVVLDLLVQYLNTSELRGQYVIIAPPSVDADVIDLLVDVARAVIHLVVDAPTTGGYEQYLSGMNPLEDNGNPWFRSW